MTLFARYRRVNRELMDAARQGNAIAVRRLLGQGAKVNVEMPRGVTPLSVASRSPRSNAETVRALLENGAQPKGSKRYPGYPLIGAAQLGNLDILRLLLDAGADVNARDVTGTPLIWAVRETTAEVVGLLLEAGADPNLVSAYDPRHVKDGCETPLMLAAARGEIEIARLLIQYGADVSRQNAAGTTALMWAERLERYDVAEVLRGMRSLRDITMSIIGNYKGVRPERLEEIIEKYRQREDTDAVSKFLHAQNDLGERIFDKPDPKLNIGKSWHGIHFLLNGQKWGGQSPLFDVVLGGKMIGEDYGNGPARYLLPVEVKAVSNALSQFDRDELRKRFRPIDFAAAEIYPQGWNDGSVEKDFAWLWENLCAVRDFFQQAAQYGDAMLLYLN